VKLHLKSIAALILSVIAYLPSPTALAEDGNVVEASRAFAVVSYLTSTIPVRFFLSAAPWPIYSCRRYEEG
jgi:hypothetical protein